MQYMQRGQLIRARRGILYRPIGRCVSGNNQRHPHRRPDGRMPDLVCFALRLLSAVDISRQAQLVDSAHESRPTPRMSPMGNSLASVPPNLVGAMSGRRAGAITAED
jgi:hypothetical protein